MGVVYMLSYENLAYIGSTMRNINKRMNNHKDYRNNCGSKEIIKNENYEVIIIEYIENETKEECREREQFWIEFYGINNLTNKYNAELDLNKNKKYLIKYYELNKDKINKKQSQYDKLNKDKILKRHKEYYYNNKIKIAEKSRLRYLDNKNKK